MNEFQEFKAKSLIEMIYSKNSVLDSLPSLRGHKRQCHLLNGSRKLKTKLKWRSSGKDWKIPKLYRYVIISCNALDHEVNLYLSTLLEFLMSFLDVLNSFS